MAGFSIPILTAISIAILTYILYQRILSPLKRIPGPFFASISRLWLVYHSSLCQRHLLEKRLHIQYGPIVRISPDEVCISDPSYVKVIHGATSGFVKSDWYEVVAPKDKDAMNLLGERDMEKYRLQRRLIGPCFTVAAVKAREKLLHEPILKFLEKIKSIGGQKGEVDLVKWMNILSLDMLTRITWGQCADYVGKGDDDGNSADVNAFWGQIQIGGLMPWAWKSYSMVNEWLGTYGVNAFFVANIGKLAIIKYYVSQVTSRATSTTPSSKPLADLASDIDRFSATHPALTPVWTATIKMHIIGAGFDTLGMTLASVLFWVAKTPGCQAKLQAELDKSRRDENLSSNRPEEDERVNGDENLESNVPNYDATIKLPYLQACITEAMRLTPTIGVSLPRTVPKNGCTILGTFLPADTVVGINPYIIQRSPEIFGSDAEEFRPERWIEADAAKRLEMESVNLVFGGASRSCPGRNLAWMCASKAIAAIMERLNIEILADEEVKDIKGDKAGFREECFFKLQWYGIWVRMKERN